MKEEECKNCWMLKEFKHLIDSTEKMMMLAIAISVCSFLISAVIALCIL